MGILSGGMTVRRFQVEGELAAGWRERLRDQLGAMAFREPAGGARGEEIEGWVQADDLLATSFDNPNAWLIHPWVVFALRVDKKALPANLLKATVAKECREWCESRGAERIPASEKKRIKEAIEDRWFSQQLPRVTLVEVAWNVVEGHALIGTTSSKMIDRVRTRFHRTFGLELHPWSPLDDLSDSLLAEDLLATTPLVGGEA